MVVVFSVNGSLASYSIEFINEDHVIASMVYNGEKRKDIPEKIEFFCKAGLWTSDTNVEAIHSSIIHVLEQADQPEKQ